MRVLDERETAGTALESPKIVQMTYLLINEHFQRRLACLPQLSGDERNEIEVMSHPHAAYPDLTMRLE